MKISITAGNTQLVAQLYDTPTARLVYQALPVASTVAVWGRELFFPLAVPVQLGPEARDEMRIGELAYWPEGQVFCIFFGKTPVSFTDLPRAYSPVNPFGLLAGQFQSLCLLRGGESIFVERVE